MIGFDDYIRQIRQAGSLRDASWYDTTNEVIRLMYSTLGWLVRDKWGKLVITKSHILYGKGKTLHEHFDEIQCREAAASGSDDCTTFREAMSLIYQNDERVRQHFQVVDETPEAVTYQILPDPLPDKQ